MVMPARYEVHNNNATRALYIIINELKTIPERVKIRLLQSMGAVSLMLQAIQPVADVTTTPCGPII